MTKYLLAAAAVAAISTAAYAGDSKPVLMTDEQMDQVTAAGQPPNPGEGWSTAAQASDFRVKDGERFNGPHQPAGIGVCTTGQSGRC